MAEPLDLLTETIRVKRFDRFDDTGVKITAPLLEEAAVRDLMRERVLEGDARSGKRLVSIGRSRPNKSVRRVLSTGALLHTVLASGARPTSDTASAESEP